MFSFEETVNSWQDCLLMIELQLTQLSQHCFCCCQSYFLSFMEVYLLQWMFCYTTPSLLFLNFDKDWPLVNWGQTVFFQSPVCFDLGLFLPCFCGLFYGAPWVLRIPIFSWSVQFFLQHNSYYCLFPIDGPPQDLLGAPDYRSLERVLHLFHPDLTGLGENCFS